MKCCMMMAAAAATAAAVAAAVPDCAHYNQAECLPCKADEQLVCRTNGMPMPGDACNGRQVCAQCIWNARNATCVSAGGASGMLHGKDGSMTMGPMTMGPMPMPPMEMMMMQMWFEQSETVTILFKGWKTKNTGQYLASCVFVVILSTLVTVLRRWVDANTGLDLRYRTPLYFTAQVGVYFIMLITMTFNVLIFFSVIAGITLGWLFCETRMVKGGAYSECH